MGQRDQERNQKIPWNKWECEDTTIQNLWDTRKIILRGKFIAAQAYLKTQENTWMNIQTSHIKELKKEQQSVKWREGKK